MSLDGGGIKGTFTAAVLAEWERITKCKLTDHFDYCGNLDRRHTCARTRHGPSAQTMLEFYEQRGPTVFPMTKFGQRFLATLRSLIKPKFAQEILRSELATAFDGAPRKILRDARCRLVIPSCHARTGGVHIFRTNHHPALTAAKESSATDIASATAAAPTYFRAAEVDDRAYVDGGVSPTTPAWQRWSKRYPGSGCR